MEQKDVDVVKVDDTNEDTRDTEADTAEQQTVST